MRLGDPSGEALLEALLAGLRLALLLVERTGLLAGLFRVFLTGLLLMLLRESRIGLLVGLRLGMDLAELLLMLLCLSLAGLLLALRFGEVVNGLRLSLFGGRCPALCEGEFAGLLLTLGGGR